MCDKLDISNYTEATQYAEWNFIEGKLLAVIQIAWWACNVQSCADAAHVIVSHIVNIIGTTAQTVSPPYTRVQRIRMRLTG